MTQTCFERTEKKYLITQKQADALCQALRGKLVQDGYGLHTICNLYMDTDDYTLIRRSLEKPIYKEKLRIRSYGPAGPDSTVFIELKKKYKGIVYKRRVPMTLRGLESYLHGGLHTGTGAQILREIDYFRSQYEGITCKAFIAYERQAFTAPQDEGVRVTLDMNIRYRDTHLDLSQGAWGTPLLSRHAVLMEIKVPGAMPLWLCHALSDLGIKPTSFSKYGMCYQAFIQPYRFAEGLANVS